MRWQQASRLRDGRANHALLSPLHGLTSALGVQRPLAQTRIQRMVQCMRGSDARSVVGTSLHLKALVFSTMLP